MTEMKWWEANPPTLPLRPSEYGLIIRRETNPELREDGANFSGADADGGALSGQQLDILKAIAGGAPVDMSDPGVQV